MKGVRVTRLGGKNFPVHPRRLFDTPAHLKFQRYFGRQ
jgi:hypothetical protein